MPAVIFMYQPERAVGACGDFAGWRIAELPCKELPLVFWLRLDGETTLRFCTVAWHSENYIGVEFSEQITERRRAERWGEPVGVCIKPQIPL